MDLTKRIAALSPEQRRLLLQQLNQETANRSAFLPILPQSRETTTFPLSFSQERLWFLDQLEPGNPVYNMPAAIRLKGALNLDCLERAINEIIARHEVLRTNFQVIDDQPVQTVAPFRSVPLTFTDLSHLPVEEQMAEAQRLVKQETTYSFNLHTDVLIRTGAIKLNAEEYVFLLNMHHIVSDGWSITVFARELTILYTAFVNNQPNPLPPLPIQYVDFAQWQRAWLQGERLEAQLAYWKEQLSGDLPQLDMLLDKPRPAVQSHQSGRVTLELSASLCEALRHLSQQEDATLFMTLLAAFKLLLYRQTGVEDIIVGSPIAGRNRAETENLIGVFLNTLALRTDLSDNPTFRGLIQRVKRVAMDAYSHQDIPFERLLIDLQPERNLSHSPIFQIFFNMLNLDSGQAQELPGITAEVFEALEIGAKFDLTLYLAPKSQGLSVNLVYNSGLFTQEHMECLLAQYEHLLSLVATQPDTGLNSYSLVTPNTQSLLPNPRLPLVDHWYGTVHTRFSDIARQYPDEIALIDRDASWSYQKLDRLSNQLASYLRSNGIKSQDIVAVYAHRSASLVWALLGILKAGAAFVILDAAYPPQRLIDYLQVAEPHAWLQLEAAGSLPATLEKYIESSSYSCRLTLPATPAHAEKLMGQYSEEPLAVTVEAEDLAYIAFTSGSTGHPKGILGSHKPISHFIQWHIKTFELKQNDRFSMLSGLAHDPLLRDIFTPLWLGATLHIPAQEQILSPGQLARWMAEERITIAHLTPTLEQVLTEILTNDAQAKLDHQRYAFLGGEPLTRQHVFRLRQLAPNLTCVNFYGTTETPQAMGYAVVSEQNDVIPLGRGIEDVQLLILNASEVLAGIGEIGEIYVRTPYLSQGYLGDETLNQQRFVRNPFTGDPTDKMYRTGDLGRYLPNGEIQFLGRNDTQVKIRGFRIELSEIEATLLAYPAVQQAVVSVWESVSVDKRITAYIIATPSQPLNRNDLRSFLKEHLPDHMIPSHFITLDALPLTPNGKVDRKALPAPDLDPSIQDSYVPPQTETEKTIAQIWTDILKVPHIGVHDNFFELGGHSLLATRVVSRIRKAFQLELPLRDFFKAPTVSQSAELIETITWATRDQIASSGDSVDEGEEFIL